MMINLAGLMGRITGKGMAEESPQMAGGKAGQAQPQGVATGGAFAALVRHVAEADGQTGAGRPRLVVDNSADLAPSLAPTPAMSNLPAAISSDSEDMPVLDGGRPPAWQATTEAEGPDGVKSQPDDMVPAVPVHLSLAKQMAVRSSRAEKMAEAEALALAVRETPESDAPAEIVPVDEGTPDTAREADQPAMVTTPDRLDPALLEVAYLPAPASTNESAGAPPPARTSVDATPSATGPVRGAAVAMAGVAEQAEGQLSRSAPISEVGTEAPAVAPSHSAGRDIAVSRPATASEAATPEMTSPAQRPASPPTGERPVGIAAQAVSEQDGKSAPVVEMPNPAAVRPALKPDGSSGTVKASEAKSGMADQVPVAPAPSSTATASSSERPASFHASSEKGSSPARPNIGEAPSMSAPVRAIVEGLPPVLQSELMATPVRVVAGPAPAESAGAALGEQVIDMGVSGQWIDRMAREITDLAAGTGHSRFTLSPPHLGRLEIDLWRDGAETNVRLLAETDEAARRLAEGRPALQGDARLASISLGTITVEKAATQQDTAARDDRSGQPREGTNFAGQSGQQHGEGDARGRAGHGQQGDWVSRIARDEPNQRSDASSRLPSGRAADGRVRFA
ncbi:flagellar hook-length control protein FliK [Sphingobium lignivorans]|uniref:Flagellar hook-length control protein FliK n=1 Tax=Sphingobium lignivorans TaxID=2735886 RepID=A0ABR6NAJ6_9SPHN|nr:flagellar hook-length control protein FliK [Sphingobium lignivorans]MBB5984287.1 flagellar hook-length control protein FliK [Sphingobium lignivorans]